MNRDASAEAVRVFSNVFSDFAFLFGDPVDAEELPPPDGRLFLACLPFQGQVRGSIEIGVPEGLAFEIAANTLGVDPADPQVPAKAPDALKEVASVMGGHLATTLADTGTSVALSPPRLESLDEAQWERLRTDGATLCFSMNDHPVLFRFACSRGGSST